MLTIILTFKKNNNISDIINYLKHINNIIYNFDIKLEILIINCNSIINSNEISDYNSLINSHNKITHFKIYNYSCNYDDSIHNEILSFTNYNSILYTDFDIYLTETFIEWITLNTIQDNTFIRTNIFDLNNIPTQFLENFNNDIYNDILSKLLYITNEQGINQINSNVYMENFNNNTCINIINSTDIINHKLHYLHYSNKFLLTTKNTIQTTGFNINNVDYNYTFQYVILNFIKNNYSMIKFPFLISCYKLYTEVSNILLEPNIEFSVNTIFNNFINYKVYDIMSNKTNSYIRNKIKTLKGYNPIDTIKQNAILNKEIKNLEDKINIYENSIKNTELIKTVNNEPITEEIINNEISTNQNVNHEIVDDTIVDDTIVDDTIVDDTIVDDTIVDDTIVDDTIVDDTIVDDTIVDDTIVDDTNELKILKNQIKNLKKKNKILKKTNKNLQNLNTNLIQNITNKNINNIILKLHDMDVLNKQIQKKINKQKKNLFILQNLKNKFKN